MKTMKKIVAILAVALMLCSILPLSVFAAEGDNVADFNTVTNTSTSYVTSTTTNGWKAENSAVLAGAASGNNNPNFNFIDTNTATRAFCMNGKTSAIGKITSPTLSGGISKLTLNYGLPFSDTKLSFTITITGADGTSATKTVNPASVTKLTKYELVWDLETPITGNFTIVIKNNCPSNSTSNKDRTAIWNVAWEPAAVGCDHASLACGAKCPNCGETKEHKFSNICVAKCENGCGTANPAYVAGHDYSNAYDTTCNVCGATREVTFPEADSTLTLPDATALGKGVDSNQYTTDKYYVTGTIVETYGDKWATYGNFYIEDAEGNRFLIYGIYIYNEDGTKTRYDAMTVKPEIGVTITVYGVIGNYNGTAQMKDSGLISMDGACAHEYEYECATTCKLCGKGERDVVCVNDTYACQDGLCIYCGNDVAAVEHAYDDQWDPDCNYGCGETREVEEKPDFATITFDDTSKRTEQTTEIQIWIENGITVTNNKASATSDIIDSSNPVRFYKNSEVVVAYVGMTTIEFYCNTAAYATALADSIGDGATVNEKVVTVKFDAPVDTYTVALTGGQVRMDSITVYGASNNGDEDCVHSWNDATCTAPATCSKCGATDGAALGHNYSGTVMQAPSCTNTGLMDYYCSACGDTYNESIAAAGHNFVNGHCAVCGAELPSEATIDFSTTAQRVEIAIESQKWENNGLVLINNKGTGNNIADYSNPIRMYKNSEIIISFPGMTSLVIDATGVGTDYLWAATLNAAGLTYTVEEKIYTITFAEPTNSITLTAANQVRAMSITASAVKTGCAHEYDNACDVDCNLCYEAREVQHSVQHVAAVAATCVANGNIEYWYCDVCGLAWLDEACTLNTNLKAVKLPATGEHEYDDDYDADCNLCGDVREVPEQPVDVIYGDADGDGEITLLDATLLSQYLTGWEVTLDEAAADADGDGEITLLDATLLSQYLTGWDVVLGPDDSTVFNDGTLTVW